MRTSLAQYEAFYETRLGGLVTTAVRHKLFQAWGHGTRLRVAGFGYVVPFLSVFDQAERCVSLIPHGIGVRAGAQHATALVDDHAWPIADCSLDRVVIIHGLEEVSGPRRLIREVWRVLADDGLLILASVNRRGLWSVLENTPFAAGRPYSRHQMDVLLAEAMFAPTARATGLHFPPFDHALIRALARRWESMGSKTQDWSLSSLLPNLAGMNFVEARKSMALPISGSKSAVFRPGSLLPAALPHPVQYDGAPLLDTPLQRSGSVNRSQLRDGNDPQK